MPVDSGSRTGRYATRHIRQNEGSWDGKVQMLSKNWVGMLMKRNQGMSLAWMCACDRKHVEGVNTEAVQPFYAALQGL
jgi:hypothetical protein